jgi:amidophosphoribosyltransferase
VATSDKLIQVKNLKKHYNEGVIKAIGLPPCELCTYCWNGKE